MEYRTFVYDRCGVMRFVVLGRQGSYEQWTDNFSRGIVLGPHRFEITVSSTASVHGLPHSNALSGRYVWRTWSCGWLP